MAPRRSAREGSRKRPPAAHAPRATREIDSVRLDGARWERTGVAEAIYGDGKSPGEIAAIGVRLVEERRLARQESRWPVLATRVPPDVRRSIEAALGTLATRLPLRYDEEGAVLEFAPPARREPLGHAAVVSAGTTDRGPASEAAFVLEAYGARVARVADVGVAGLHRLLAPATFEALETSEVVVVVAGMEGALPTVVAGLVKAPVVAVPAPVGYGVAKDGVTALHTMLASCAPGLAVVNIGNGFGAAAMAVKILRQARRGA